MKDLALRVFRNPAVRKAFVALVLAALAAAGISLGAGCGRASLPPAVAKAQAVLECQLAALEDVVPLSVAEDLVMAARAGNGAYVVKQLLLGLGLTPEDVTRTADAFQACASPAVADEPSLPTLEQN